MRCKVIYELKIKDVLKEAIRKLDVSKNDMSHIGFTERWAQEIGTVVYRNK